LLIVILLIANPLSTLAADAANTITITNKSGSIRTNYLLQFGRPFVQREILNYPQVKINGLPARTQADVKNRWPDGSVKFAVIAAIIPSLPASGNVVLTFGDQPSSNNAPIVAADLLTQFPDFDAVIKISGASVGAKSSASARQMLADGNCKPWTSGLVAQTMICADRSEKRVYDMGSDQWRSLHPEFVITFWPATKQVFVRYVGEISNSQALEAFPYDLELTTGKANPQSVYKQAGVTHSIATRWTRTAWLGGTPEPKVNINHNVGYLAATRYIANYRSVTIPEGVTASYYDRWLKSDRSINGAGLWKLDMPGVGYHAEIGPMPVWYVNAVFTGDWRDREVMLGQAGLVGAFPLQIREGDPARFADRAKTVPAIGRTISSFARPRSWGLDVRENPSPDTIIIRSPNGGGFYKPDLYNWHDFQPDEAHEPDPFFVPYILTGDPYYLDGLQLWVGLHSAYLNPDCGPTYRCGATGVINTEVRGNAWELRNRRHAWAASPDDDPMKAVFAAMLDDALAWWEGQRDIRGTKYENTPTWNQSHQYFGTNYSAYSSLPLPPLHTWNSGEYGVGLEPDRDWAPTFDPTVTATASLPWHQNFLLMELGRTVEMGFTGAQGAFAWAGQNMIGKLTDPGYRIQLVGEYLEPVQKMPGKWFASWSEVLPGWSAQMRSQKAPLYWPATGGEFYWDVAHAAASLVTTLPGGAAAWQRFEDGITQMSKDTGAAPNWNRDPTWALAPQVK